jgi:hypothetical protein
LQLHHQLNQLVLAQTLQISAVHWAMDSEIAVRGKGLAEISSRPADRRSRMGVGNYA